MVSLDFEIIFEDFDSGDFVYISYTTLKILLTLTSAIFRIFMFLCSTFVDVNLSNFSINLKSLFCITCILFTLFIEVLPYISKPYFILEKIKA